MVSLPALLVAAATAAPLPAEPSTTAGDSLLPASTPRQQEPTTFNTDAPADKIGDPRRTMLMEANLRFRYLSVPDGIMDIWFFDSDDPGANDFDRPKVRMYALGVEYVLKPRPHNWIFYYEYMGSLIKEGYWDDVEEPPQHDDGDWVNPERLGIHVVGANYAHEIEVTSSENSVWLSMLFGAGLGVGFVQGDFEQWHPGGNAAITNDCFRESPAYERKDHCVSDGVKRIPSLLPVLDLTGSFRVNFAERANARLDFGLHDLFYAGAAVGGVF